MSKGWNIFLKIIGEITPLIFKNKFKNNSKLKIRKSWNIEARHKIRCCFKKEESILYRYEEFLAKWLLRF